MSEKLPYGPKITPFETDEDKNGVKTILLSVPRSGVHWFGYCINRLTMRFVNAHSTSDHNRFETSFSREKAPIYLYHDPHSVPLPLQDEENNKLILLVRNHKETIIRNFGDWPENGTSHKENISAFFNNPNNDKMRPYNLMAQLEIYDVWPETNRLLVHYEDLIQNPRKTLIMVMYFLEEPITELNGFMNNYEKHRHYMLNLYNSKWYGPSQSGGNDIHYHSNRVSPELLSEIDQSMKRLNPELFDKYLKRYVT